MGNKQEYNSLVQLIEEVEYEMKDQGFLDEEENIGEISTIDIEMLIGKIESELHSASFINFLIVPLGLFFSAMMAIIAVNLEQFTNIFKLTIFIFTTLFVWSLLYRGTSKREQTKKQTYLKQLLLVYLKYGRVSMYR